MTWTAPETKGKCPDTALSAERKKAPTPGEGNRGFVALSVGLEPTTGLVYLQAALPLS